MKKIVLFVALIFFSVSFIHSQIGWGVKGGLTAAKINLDLQDNLSGDFIYGGHGGVFLKIGEGTVSLQPEVMFIQKGVHVSDMQSEDYAETRLNYLEVPLLARTSVGIKATEIYFHFGGYGSYMLSKKESFKVSDNEQEDANYEVSSCNDWDGGVIIGAGVKVLSLVFEVRYGHGLVNVCNDTDTYQESKNQYVNVSLGVQF